MCLTKFSGGGQYRNENLDLNGVPLQWMQSEASKAGLRLQSNWEQSNGNRNLEDLKNSKAYKSLTSVWWLLECLPFRRQSLTDSSKVTL